MKKWKIKLTRQNSRLGEIEYRHCVEAETMDIAIAKVKSLAPIPEDAKPLWTSAAQTFSDVENSDPLEAERIFLETGNFNAYLQLMGKAQP